MTSRGRAKAIRWALVASLAFGVVSGERAAYAQSNQELEGARKKFQDAYKLEQDGKYEEALELFQEVAQVKESASVKYRIAKNQAQLNRLRVARDGMRALAASKSSLPPKDQNIADSAAAEVVELDKKIPKLSVKVQDKPPADTRISVDGQPIPSGGTPQPIEVDPGEHTVIASGAGMKRFEKKVTLGISANETVTVQFEPEAIANGGGNGSSVETPPPPPPPSRGVLPYILVIGGGALVIIGGSVLLSREGTIDDINEACPNNVCPTSRQGEIEDKRDSAETALPVGLAVLGVGAVATGLGVYLFVRPLKQADQPTNGTQPAPRRGQSVHFGPKPIRGGMMLGLGATF